MAHSRESQKPKKASKGARDSNPEWRGKCYDGVELYSFAGDERYPHDNPVLQPDILTTTNGTSRSPFDRNPHACINRTSEERHAERAPCFPTHQRLDLDFEPTLEDTSPSLASPVGGSWSLVKDSSDHLNKQCISLPSEFSSTESSPDPLDLAAGPHHWQPELEEEPSETLVNSFKSAWNNMRNGFTWNTKTNFKYETPILLLGSVYCCTKEEKEIQKKAREDGLAYLTTFDQFLADFSSRIWFTYRRDFPTLPNSTLTTDIGWGCMLRTGQMIVAQALVSHLLGRDWRFRVHRSQDDFLLHRKILQFFGDYPSPQCPFSIHHLVEIGDKMLHKPPGDWYGPSSVAHVLKQALEEAALEHPLLSQLCIYVAQDCTVYVDDLMALCHQPVFDLDLGGGAAAAAASSSTDPSSSSNSFHPLILLIPVRLGSTGLNKIYIPCIRNMLGNQRCIGIIGGKPRHSLYFVGFQEDNLIYLDPHFCQGAVDTRRVDFDAETFHCHSPRKMPASKMDPSCTIGFYCKTRKELDTLIEDIKKTCVPPMEKSPHPMIVFQHGSAADHMTSGGVTSENQKLIRVYKTDQFGRKLKSDANDDFVYL